MTDQPRVEITLLGQTLSLRSDADPKYLRSLAASIVCSAVAESFGFMNTGCP